MFMRCSLQLSAFHVLILNKAHVQSLLFTTFLVLHPQKETRAMLFYFNVGYILPKPLAGNM